ncbi:MAG: hypothetical protein M3R24_40705 [Chloroflexota bacterium]|nr:hypothetical protein [Chloroflexota bacterium]
MQELTQQRTTSAGLARPWHSGIPWNFFGLWLALRLLTFAWAAYISSQRPVTLREQRISFWSSSSSLTAWLERFLLAPWERYDVVWYIRIVQNGYRADDGTAQFHPLFAWLSSPLAWLTGQPLVGLLTVSSLASLLVLFAFWHLARLDLNANLATISTTLFVSFPVAFVLFIPYTEGLWLLCAIICLYCARRGLWWRAGLAGMFATLTRQQGVFLLLPVAWELWAASAWNWRRAMSAWRSWCALLLIPLGLLVWLIYRALLLNDLNSDFSNLHSTIYSIIISPSANQVVPIQSFMTPVQALWLAIGVLYQTPSLPLIIDLVLGSVFVLMLILAWPRLRTSYRIYSVVIFVVSFGYNTGPFYPYMGLPRHLLLAFPVFIGAAPLLNRSISRMLVLSMSLLGFFFCIMTFVLYSWVP